MSNLNPKSLPTCPVCHTPRIVRISRTAANPNRPFMTCPHRCQGSFAWLDTPVTDSRYTQSQVPLSRSTDDAPNSINQTKKRESERLLPVERGGGTTTGLTTPIAGQPVYEDVPSVVETPAPTIAGPLNFLSGKASAVHLVSDIGESDAPAGSSPSSPFVPSKYQAAIFDFLQSGEGNGVVIATAGSGKTRTLKECAPYLPKRSKVAAIAFNKRAAIDLERVMPESVKASTFHSLGLSNVKRQLGRVQVDEDKVWKALRLIEKGGGTLAEVVTEDGAAVRQLVSLVKNTLTPPDDAGLTYICDRYGIDLNGNASGAYEVARMALSRGEADTATADFDDMLWWCATGKVSCEQFDFLLVDELNDTNQAQIEFIKRSLKPGARLLGVGDPKQCHPGNTMIAMTGGGYKPISRVEVGEQVVSYSTLGSNFTGVRTQGRKILEIAKRPYKGRLIVVHTDNYAVCVTPNHRMLTRFHRGGYCVYVMQKGNQIRVGSCQLSYKANFGLGMRCRQEQADKGWILDIFDDREEAYAEENRVSIEYGLPQILFRGTTGYPRIDRIIKASWVDMDNYHRLAPCLEAYGREEEYPLYIKGESGKIGRKSFLTQACNLVDGFMTVKEFDGQVHTGKWSQISLEERSYSGYVYSLSVEPTEGGRRVYVADNIVVGNSIYGFRGSAPDAIDQVIRHTQATTLPLSITYRLPLSHVQHINSRFPDIAMEAREGAPDGIIGNRNYDQMVADARDGDLVIARTNAVLVKPCFEIIRAGRKAIILGRDVSKGLVGILSKIEKRNPGADLRRVLSALHTYTDNECAKLMAAHKNNQCATLLDTADTIYALADGCYTVSEVRQKISAVFSDDARGVVFSTGHKIKGSESNQVFYYMPERVPHKLATEPWQLQGEANLDFVMRSRSKNGLYFVAGEDN